MPNYVTICYEPCEPTPGNGYLVQYRPSGSAEGYRLWPANFFPSISELAAGHAVAQLLVTGDPDGKQYEGFIYGDCPSGLGVASPWTTGDNPPESDSGSSSSASASASDSGTPVPDNGTIRTDACFTEGAITEVRFNGFDVLDLVGSFPVDSGESIVVGVGAPGTHTLRVNVTLTNPSAGRLTVTDSLGEVQCAIVSGVDDVSFPGFTIVGTDGWSVVLDCGTCD